MSPATMYTTASMIFKTLADAGITHAFVNWGNDHPAFLEDLERGRVESGKTPIEIITCPHEMVALSAAQGYAQVTGKPAAVIVHVDVGTQGLGGAVHNVDRGHTPVIIIAGAAPQSSDRRLKGTKNEWPMWYQDVPDQPSIVRQYMRFTAQIQSAKNTRQMVMRALQIATSQPKGPVYLWARRETTEEEVDASIFNEKLDISKWPSVQGGGLPNSALKTIVDALLVAQFPLIITANSGRNPKTVPLLSELSSLLAIGVYTSCPMSVCIPWTHENYIGSAFGGKNDLLDHADLLILLEVDIPWVEAAGNKPRDDARVFIIDSDPLKTNLGWSHVDAELLCKADPETALQQLISALDVPEVKNLVAPKVASRRARLRETRSAWVAAQESAEAVKSVTGEHPDVPFVLATLRNAVATQTPSKGEKVLWVNEAISSYPLCWAYLRPEQPGSMIASGATSIGYGLGASIGAYLGGVVANKDYELIAYVVGDGTFLFGIPASAYWIAKRYDTPFLTVILNNGGWKSPKLSMLGVYPNGLGSVASGNQLTVGFGPDMPDFSQVAVAAGGAWGKRVTKADEVQAALEEAIRVVLQEKRSAVVDVVLEVI
ncbi:thiamine pyrophosphate enzyme, N-terminal TPP binding domain-containing protein [Dichomitus squalens]|uniref:Thiamine pyrophosphate enzyme, N-terminal TPP binding domain-containing protein n=2 Tax=Dichomitus squalens TaxID=114155 RepID=A0A4Q9PKZ9_9APHY|nr:thiamine pyrophosphate enzyme, N-terminal TPP binding domain-containing protein [Dichomitus squalens]TBU54831.1 thiamine pyrophosphate enzyme, N-terminal TPP binding domain-containing protein [Dichomitus squalens]